MSQQRRRRARSPVRFRGLCFGVMLLTLSAVQSVAQVNIRVVDTEVDGSREVDVAFDATDGIFVAYWLPNHLMLAEAACSKPAPTAIYTGTGEWTSLAIGSDGAASVTHFGFASTPTLGFRLCYSIFGGVVGGPQTGGIFASDYGMFPVLALDSVDRPYVVYAESPGPPMFAWFDIVSGQWITQIVPGPNLASVSVRAFTIGVNNQDEPVVAYVSRITGDECLTVATLTDGGWIVRSHDVSGIGGVAPYRGVSLAFDSVDAPHVVYVNHFGEITVLTFNMLNVTSQVATFESAFSLGPHAMGIDSINRIKIATIDQNTNELMLVENDFGWDSHVVDTEVGDVRAGLALDSQDRWVIAYVDMEEDAVKVAGPTVPIDSPGDCDCDDDVDEFDYVDFEVCLSSSGVEMAPGCECFDLDDNGDLNCDDWDLFRSAWTGPPAEPPILPECDNAKLIDSTPAHEESLWRTANNFIRLTFDADIAEPADGELLIEVMNSNGAFGTSYTIATDTSADFTVEVVNDGGGDPRILEIWENGSVLTHTDWIAVHNLGDWPVVAEFHRHYPVMMGDVDGNGDVLPTDFGPMFPKIPTFGSEPDERADVDGNGDILPTDFGPMFPQIPTFGVDYPKPTGH